MSDYRDILIIKAEPRIEVLQATCLLKTLSLKYPGERVVWVTSRRNQTLLQGNPYISELYCCEAGGWIAAQLNRRFKLVISLETSQGMGDAANWARGQEKYGLYRNNDGEVKLFNKGADKLSLWISTSGREEELKELTYQKILLKAAGCSDEIAAEMVFTLPEKAIEFACRWREERQIGGGLLAGIYLGYNPRLGKMCPDARSVSFLAEELIEELKVSTVIFAGPKEKGFFSDFMHSCPPGAADGGCLQSFTELTGVIGRCGVLFGLDSLGMQLALAMGKKVVVLEESAKQQALELYGRGHIVLSDASEFKAGRKVLRFSPQEAFRAVKSLLDEMK